MWLILLWLGGLSLAGCIVWAAVFGLTIEAGLATLASLFVADIGFRYTGRMRRLKVLEHLGYVYICGAAGAFCGFVVLEVMQLAIPLSLWAVLPFACLGWALVYFARHCMKRAGLLFDLRRVGTLPTRIALQENIKCEGYEVVTGFSQYGSSKSQRGRVFLEHKAQLPCIIRAEGGSVDVYEISGKKPASHVKQAILLDLTELVASLKATSKELKGRVIEVTPARTSVLLKKYELTPEELARVCQVLLRVEAGLGNYLKGELDEVDRKSKV